MVQSILPSGLSVAVNFGTVQIKHKITFGGLTVAVGIGTVTFPSPQVFMIGVPVSVGIGTPSLVSSILPSGIEVSVYS